MSVPLQVTIEVVVDPQDELEMDLMAEPSNRWSEGAPRWQPAEELFWPLSWGYLEGEEERPHLKSRTSGEEQEALGYEGHLAQTWGLRQGFQREVPSAT